MITVVKMQFGSHLYGTSTPASDFDFKAVHVPDGRSILLGRVKEVVNNHRSKAHGEKTQAGEVEDESFALHRYLELLSEGQTVALDMLFAPPSAWIGDASGIWTIIRANRTRLLTKKSAAFVGYCRTQANKYGIKGSRVAAARAARDLFKTKLEELGTTAKINEIQEDVAALCHFQEHTSIVWLPSHKDGPDVAHLECCNKKMPFTNTIKHGYELYERVFNEYGQRALAAETGVGIDWKALSHAVRVGNEALELFRTGNITFPLPTAARILDIKLGRLPYDEVAAEIEGLLAAVEEAGMSSSLPERADKDFIDDLVCRVYTESVNAREMP